MSRRSFDIYYKAVFGILSKYFAKMVDKNTLLAIFAKLSTLDVWQGSEYTSVLQYFAIIASIDYLFHRKI